MTIITWADEFIETGDFGLESFSGDISQDVTGLNTVVPYFKPVNTVVENGTYYTTIYACCALNRSVLCQQLMIWLGSLKETDVVKLSITAMSTGIPIQFNLSLLAAIVRCKATIEIQLDSIVCDNLAYFYLAADKINVGYGGSLFIPSYIDSRQESKSTNWKIVHDFVQELVDRGFSKGILLEDEVERLNNGKHVVVPNARLIG
jgi:hypothetical protein